MPLSEKTKNILLAPSAISHIMQCCALPGLLGMFLLAIGFWQQVVWLKVVGAILAAPIIWVYAVVTFLFLPMAVVLYLRGRL